MVTIKSPEHLWRDFYCQLWTDFKHCSGVSIVDSEQVNAGCRSK